MSYISLVQQLSLEFMTASEFDHAQVRDDAYALCAKWRRTAGRHLPTEMISDEFDHWWRAHYLDCLRAAGSGRSYDVFLKTLAGKIQCQQNRKLL